MNVYFPFVAVAAILAVVVPLTLGKDSTLEDDEAAGIEFMEEVNQRATQRRIKQAFAEWNHATNMTEENQQIYLQISFEAAKESKADWEKLITHNWENFQNQTLKRMFKLYSRLGEAALNDDDLNKFKRVVSAMEENYAVSKVCDYFNTSKCDLNLEPEITEILAESDDPEEMKYLWEQWHQEAGAKVKDKYTEYVRLANAAARANNLSNYGSFWLDVYEQDDIEDELARLWEELTPLYQQIHAYVRGKLHDKYGDEVLTRTGPIPAHLLGNMWAQSWINTERITRPYPEKRAIDITAALREHNYTPLKIFETADEFFQSLNLPAMPQEFWDHSILEKPDDGRNILCHASAYDFGDKVNYRIKQCTRVNGEDLFTAHHEMGHIEYYILYEDQPDIFKDGANPGFHEAVGDVIALSVTTPKHLRRIGLIEAGQDDAQTELNKLFSMGLGKIAFLPFAYMVDTYRLAIFRGDTTPEDYNCHFWMLRETIQGLEPPSTRTEDHFDAAAKYHVSANVEYIRYFVSFVIQFQFHRALCEKAGEYDPNDESKKLSSCDIYQSKEAGNALKEMLSLGSSRPWQDAMEILTGQRKMDTGGLLEYFAPLYEWLEQENERTGEKIGWGPSKVQYCTSSQRAALAEARKTKNKANKKSKN